jgi:hypothetical protein
VLAQPVSRRTPPLSRVTLGPRDDVFTLPDSPHGQYGLWLGKIGIGVKQLVNALSRDPEDLRNFRHTHEVLWHNGNLASHL